MAVKLPYEFEAFQEYFNPYLENWIYLLLPEKEFQNPLAFSLSAA